MSDSSKVLVAVVSMLATGAVVQTVGAAERGGFDRVIGCAGESDDTRRLACYDREIASVKAQASKASSGSTAAAPAPPAPARPAAAPVDDFGIEGSEIARQRKNEAEQAHGKAEARSISAKIAEVSTRPRGELVLTLDNGQTWAQKKPEPYFPIKVGDPVTIHAGMLGSFRLVSGNRSTQVTRIR